MKSRPISCHGGTEARGVISLHGRVFSAWGTHLRLVYKSLSWEQLYLFPSKTILYREINVRVRVSSGVMSKVVGAKRTTPGLRRDNRGGEGAIRGWVK